MEQSPVRHRFTVDDFHRMGAAGILDEDQRVELLDGQVVEMAAIGSRHALCVARLNRYFVQRLAERAVVWPQNPVRIDQYTELVPDLALLRPPEDSYGEEPPGPADVLLLIEVADTTVATDRRVKMPVYARAGIEEAWLVDLPEERIEVYHEPDTKEGRFAKRRAHRPGAVLSPSACPDLEVGVDDLLP